MTAIQQNRYDQLVRRVSNIVSGGSMVNDALSELFPMIDVENLNAELSLLTGWRLAHGAVEKTAIAANNNLVQLFNPDGSGQLAVVERVDIRVGTGQFIEYAMAATPLTNFTANQEARDSREGIPRNPVAQMRDVTQAGSLPNFGVIFVEGNVTFTMEEKLGIFVLAPNTGVTFSTTTVNTDFVCNMHWRERVAEPAELNF